jgi:sulfhydrogenase subunit alpha
MSRTIRVEHLARVEGHGGIAVELDGEQVKSVQFDIFEGARLLERLIRGRRYDEVSPIVSRICAICSVAHALTSIEATEAAFEVEVSPTTRRYRDLMFRGENIESHALHLFLLAAPDYLSYPSAIAMADQHRDAVALGLRLKKLGNLIQETVGGRTIHPVNAVVGGFGRLPANDDLVALEDALESGVSDALSATEVMASLPPAEFVNADTAFAALHTPTQYGYCGGDAIVLRRNGDTTNFAIEDYRALTNETVVPHSHAKHSRYDGQPFMVGALARLAVNGARLTEPARSVMRTLSLRVPSRNPMDNNKAQAVELILDIELALDDVRRLLTDGPPAESRVPVAPRGGVGTSVTEAPRGLLAHRYTYDDAGRILAADVVTPTAMNAASIESHFRAAVAADPAADDATLTRRLEMIARAYDPCISCSVHLSRRRPRRSPSTVRGGTTMSDTKRILVIDDDADFTESVRSLLEAEGYEVFAAASGTAGLRHLAQVRPHAILLDVMMESTTEGYGVSDAIKHHDEYAAHRDVPVLMVSSIQESPDERFPRAPETDLIRPDRYFTKPLDIPKFLDVLARVTHRR